MLIAVESIPDDGLEVQASSADPWASAAAGVALDTSSSGGQLEALDFSVVVTLIADHARVKGSLSVTAQRTCDRCGAAIRLTLDGPVDLFYSPLAASQALAVASGPELELDSGDLDIGWFDGTSLDLGHVISEQIALWLPDRVVCGADGVERLAPDGECSVAPQDPGPDLERHSPFAGLALPK